jgi:mRNA-degrading endonuclease toxin of MazEF toxin-antitoxin module
VAYRSVAEPRVVIQDDLVNEAHYPSTIVPPTTTPVADTENPLRLRLAAGTGGVKRENDVLIGPIVAVANESS